MTVKERIRKDGTTDMLRLDINLVFTLINLLILYVIIRRFLLRPVKNIIAARQAEIDKQYADAQTAQDDAEAMKKQYEETLGNVVGETEELLNEARGKANDEYERIIADARTEAEQIKANAEKTAKMERDKYMQQAKEQVADLVVAATAKIVASKQNEEADRALYNQFIAKTGE